jgi:hypothetical protein
MDSDTTFGRRRGSRLAATALAATLAVAGAIAATAVTDDQPAPAQALGFYRDGDFGYFWGNSGL